MKNYITKVKGDETRRKEIVGPIKAGKTGTEIFH